MGAIPRIWTQQPQTPVGIDWSNPITRGLEAALDARGIDYVSNALATTSGLNRSVTTRGVGVTGTSGSVVFPLSKLWSGATNGQTILVVGGWINSSSGAQSYINNGLAIGSNGYYGRLCLYDARYRWEFDGALESLPNNSVVAAISPIGIADSVGFINGVKVNTSRFTGATCSQTDNGFYSHSENSRTFVLSMKWGRILSDAEIKSLSANPWQIFKPLPRRIFAPVATSSDHLIIGANSSQTNTASDGAIGQTHLATVSNSAQANTASDAAINQTHLVSVASSNQSNVASDAAISQSLIQLVTASDSTQENTASQAAINQTHLVSVSTSTQANVSSPASITQALDKFVTAADSAQANTASAGSIQQTHLIQCAGVAIDNVASASAVVQEHLVGAANCAQGNVASAGSAITILPTIARPTSDVSNAGWTASTGSDLFAMLDEVSPDDMDYISTSTRGAVCKMALNATQYPGSAAQQLSLRASSSTGNGLSVTIKDGATTIATRSLTLTPTYDLHTITLTSGEIAAITSGNLTVEMTSI